MIKKNEHTVKRARDERTKPLSAVLMFGAEEERGGESVREELGFREWKVRVVAMPVAVMK